MSEAYVMPDDEFERILARASQDARDGRLITKMADAYAEARERGLPAGLTAHDGAHAVFVDLDRRDDDNYWPRRDGR